MAGKREMGLICWTVEEVESSALGYGSSGRLGQDARARIYLIKCAPIKGLGGALRVVEV